MSATCVTYPLYVSGVGGTGLLISGSERDGSPVEPWQAPQHEAGVVDVDRLDRTHRAEQRDIERAAADGDGVGPGVVADVLDEDQGWARQRRAGQGEGAEVRPHCVGEAGLHVQIADDLLDANAAAAAHQVGDLLSADAIVDACEIDPDLL